MKKILSVLFSVLLIGLYTSTASASHYGIPVVGQERVEVTWVCNNIDDARIYVTAREARGQVESYDRWILVLRALVSLGNCNMYFPATYVVDEVVETISGLEVVDRAFGEPIPYYIIREGAHFIVTY